MKKMMEQMMTAQNTSTNIKQAEEKSELKATTTASKKVGRPKKTTT